MWHKAKGRGERERRKGYDTAKRCQECAAWAKQYACDRNDYYVERFVRRVNIRRNPDQPRHHHYICEELYASLKEQVREKAQRQSVQNRERNDRCENIERAAPGSSA